jgi:hypothetical protein
MFSGKPIATRLLPGCRIVRGNPNAVIKFNFLSQSGWRMSSELDRKVKTALNETRLLILGVQVLLGFEFQCFFQDGFADLPTASKHLSLAGLFLVIIAIGLLVTR